MALVQDINTIEGVVLGTIWYHLDLENDVLYLQYLSTRGEETFGEDTDEGILFRDESNHVAGLTVVNWWQQNGTVRLETLSLETIQHQIEAMANHLDILAMRDGNI